MMMLIQQLISRPDSSSVTGGGTAGVQIHDSFNGNGVGPALPAPHRGPLLSVPRGAPPSAPPAPHIDPRAYIVPYSPPPMYTQPTQMAPQSLPQTPRTPHSDATDVDSAKSPPAQRRRRE